MLERKESDGAAHEGLEMKAQYSAAEVIDLLHLARHGMVDDDESLTYVNGSQPLMTLRDGRMADLFDHSPVFTSPFLGPKFFGLKRLARVYVPNDPDRMFRVGGRQEYEYQQTYLNNAPVEGIPNVNPRTTGDLWSFVNVPAGEKRQAPFSMAMSFFAIFQPDAVTDGKLSLAKVKLPRLAVNWSLAIKDDVSPVGRLQKTVDIETSVFINVFTLTPPLKAAVAPAFNPPARFPLNNNASRRVVFKTARLIPSEGYQDQFERIDLEPITHTFVAEAEAKYLIEVGLVQGVRCSAPLSFNETTKLLVEARTRVPLVSITTDRLPI